MLSVSLVLCFRLVIYNHIRILIYAIDRSEQTYRKGV